MATRIKPKTKDLHEEDFYVWAERQAALLRARRFDELDLDNVIQEVEDLGGALKRSALNNARVIMEDLLKLQHSPTRDPRRSWEATVLEHRSRLEIDLTPRIRQILQEELSEVYRLARRNAEATLRRYGEPAAADALPASCPYTLEQITGDWLP
jgi:hypothetical protein